MSATIRRPDLDLYFETYGTRFYDDPTLAAVFHAAAYTEAMERARREPIPWQLYCRDCDSAFESDDRHARLCPACIQHYTHAMLRDERNGEDDRP